MAYDYELLKVETEGRLAWVTVSNPPINLITLPLYAELVALSQELAADKDLTVVVMKSLPQRHTRLGARRCRASGRRCR